MKLLTKTKVGMCLVLFAMSGSAMAKEDISISHYFTGELGLKSFNQQVKKFEEEYGYKVKNSPVGHEDYKTDILVRAAGNSLPDVFSYWAGARTQFIADSDSLTPIDDIWMKEGLDKIIAPSIANSATSYNGKHYLVPFNYHYVGMFYNKELMKEAGITAMPHNWDEFLATLKTLKDKGITPIALGSKNRWPAQFWFDYLLLNTAGPEYREKLMNGQASYDDAEVKKAMSLWKSLVDKGYFAKNSNANDWTEASNKVANGKAAMTLMGTWITGYWNGLGLKPGQDYDFFPFPTINKELGKSVVGPVDGLLVSASAKENAGAKEFVSYMVKNVDVQADWTNAFGALSANVNVDPAKYNSVMQKAFSTVSKADTFIFNYDLSTPPPVAEIGLSMFARFMDNPSKVDSVLEQASKDAKAAFKK